jgi:hypothetical protein
MMMRTIALKAYGLLGIAGFCLLLVASGAHAAKGAQVKLVGQDDINVDRQAIQNAIDSAPGQKLTVKLKGTFQLDGTDIQITRSNLTIKGDRQGATLNGLVDSATGFPDPTFSDRLIGNRGFVMGRSGTVSNIEIKDLTLTGMRTAIFPDGLSAAVENVSLKNNTISNVIFGVTAQGMSGIEIKNNHISDVLESGIFFQFGVSDAVIAGNFVSTTEGLNVGIAPVQLFDTLIDVDVRSNTFQGGNAVILLWATATDVNVTKNCIRDGGTQGPAFLNAGGIWVGDPDFTGLEGSGFVIENNSYANNTWSLFGGTPASRDIWLTTFAEDNTVLEDQGTVVVDEGINNSVVLHGDGDPGFCN